MGYLYLNFTENFEHGSKSWDDFYTSSLKEQYERLKPKLVGVYVADTFHLIYSKCFSIYG